MANIILFNINKSEYKCHMLFNIEYCLYIYVLNINAEYNIIQY